MSYSASHSKNRLRNIRRKNEKKKAAAIAAVGSDVTPASRRSKRINKKARLVARREEIAAFNTAAIYRFRRQS